MLAAYSQNGQSDDSLAICKVMAFVGVNPTVRMLEITTLHNGMILSTLSISSHGFALGFPKRPHINRDIFLTYKPSFPKLANVGLPSNNPQRGHLSSPSQL